MKYLHPNTQHDHTFRPPTTDGSSKLRADKVANQTIGPPAREQFKSAARGTIAAELAVKEQLI